MFRIPQTETFTAKVTASIPTDTGFVEGTFEAVYRRVSTDRYADLVSEVVHDAFEGGTTLPEVIRKRRAALDEVLEGVRKIGDEKGELEPDEQRRIVLHTLPLTNAAWDAFISHYTGAAAKNSKPSPRR